MKKFFTFWMPFSLAALTLASIARATPIDPPADQTSPGAMAVAGHKIENAGQIQGLSGLPGNSAPTQQGLSAASGEPTATELESLAEVRRTFVSPELEAMSLHSDSGDMAVGDESVSDSPLSAKSSISVPEPSSWLLVLGGLAGIAAARRSRVRRNLATS